MSTKLTTRQSQILALIAQAIHQDGRPPTRAEIATALGFRSANAAEDHLRALARKGYILLVAGTSRGIQLTALAQAMLTIPGATATQQTQDTSSPTRHAANDTGAAMPPGDLPGAPAWIESADHRMLPLIGRVAAGHPILATAHIEREIPISAYLFDSPPDYLLRVRGSSMRDAGILDGDLLAVRSTPEAHHGQIIVARLGDDVTVKRLDHQGRHIRLLPENPDFSPIDISAADDFAIEGLVVGLIRTNKPH
ncbi:transcriptional repressor LexA [Castellaniella sp.]|uniref:transcriptional repressor LexA n=1 Tax=Castellaniella sp. TaxID=1955812 RepID=UPI002B0004AD|nr:transcriptional repressor LexA [Castellaniella sp.]